MREVALVFGHLGVVAFGGPAAHIALMREELVRRRGWVDDRRFVDLMGATNLLPGPNSTELALHLGHERAGWRGLLLAGVCFILPAALMVTALSWAYVEHGQAPAVTGLLYGVVPVVVAIIAWSVVGMAPTVLRSRWLVLLAVAGLAAYLAGVNELVVLFGGAGVAAVVRAARSLYERRARGERLGALGLPVLLASAVLGEANGAQLTQLFWTMLKIGSLLYGGGYVLLAFLEGDFVDRLGWITQQQLLDGISLGQVTPGPLFTTATFVGYLVAGLPGALVATVAIFLPSFVLVGLLTRLAGWLRSRTWTSALLDGVNATGLALIVGVCGELAANALVDPLTLALAALTLLVLWRTRWSSTWLILAGAAVGIAHALAT
ncbi:chromate efflux transporter [Nocardioides sp. zg-536]|uniref:Chromate efflux transporter n=1 Tax=Nocardioides faecalis TaxID=2803858 RepID=A0A939BVU4_9ACTN|nr:chromate efflux transporter [Nocardioides faecalis]QVI60498.1 chromate efflux transporter [Nocardioides faecalis]